jgi:hypothetical protein
MTMDQVLALIGQSVDSEAVQALVESAPLTESNEPDLEEGEPPRHSLTNPRDGYELTCVRGRITAAHLYLVASKEYRPFCGTLVSGLSPRSTRGEVHRVLGRPSRSGEARTVPILGRQGPWDRYDGEIVCVHFQYAEPVDRIRLITLMAADVAP